MSALVPHYRDSRKKAAKSSKDPLGIAREALSLARSLKAEVEVKRFQQTTTQTNYLAGVVTHLSGIAQGDTVSARTGDTVRLKHVDIRLNMATFTDSTLCWRVIVFSDKRQVPATAPTVLQVLDTDSAISAYALGNAADRYIIYKDFTLSQNARFLNGDMSDNFVWRVPLGNRLGRWNGANYTDGQVFMLVTCDVASAATMVGKPAAGDAATRFTVDLAFTDA